MTRYVRDWEAKKPHFEVIIGKSPLACRRDEEDDPPASKRCDCMQTLDATPQRRLYEVLKAQGFPRNQQITFLSDEQDAVRNLQLYLSPEAEPSLDWHPITMRLTVLDHYAQGLVHCDVELGEERREKMARLQWVLWHGNLYKALSKIEDIASSISPFEETYPKFTQRLKTVEEFCTDIPINGHLMPHYGERYRHGAALATGFVESTGHQVVSKRFCQKQQMQWSKRGAHLLLQTRLKTRAWETQAGMQG